MRFGHARDNFGKINFDLTAIIRILICPDFEVICADKAAFSSHFHDHVCNCHSVGKGTTVQVFAIKLHAPVVGTGSGDPTDNSQNHILRGAAPRQYAVKHNLNRLRHPKPVFASQQSNAHIRRTDAGGKCTDCTICASVRIRSQDKLSRLNMPFLNHQLVTDALAAFIKGNVLLMGKITQHLLKVGHTLIRGRTCVIHDEEYLLWVTNCFSTHALKCPDSHRPIGIMGHHFINRTEANVIRIDRFCAVCRKNFLGNCHSLHSHTPLIFSPRSSRR